MSSLAEPFANAEFRALWLARGLSLLGDQLARVALAVLVYTRTGSPALTGLVYALTFLPYLAGPVFAGIADRRPRRRLLIALDIARAGAVATMAVPGMPLPIMVLLLAAATAVTPLYDSARSAMLPEVLPPETYPAGLAVLTVTTEAAQVLGFAIGGALVATVGARFSLSLDALTYLVSAFAVGLGVRTRAAARVAGNESRRSQLRAAASLVFGSPRMRALLALAWLNALWMVPEGLAAPYADHLGAGAVGVGLLLAAIPFGCVLGAAAVGRLAGDEQRLSLMRPLAMLAALPLCACALRPGLVASLVLWSLCGVGTAYNVAANAEFVQGLPNARRGQAIALAMTGIVTGQGLAVLLAGLAASAVQPAYVVAGSGALGVAAVTALGLSWLRPPRVVRIPDAGALQPGAESPVVVIPQT